MIGIIAIYALLASTFVIAKMALGYGHPFFLIGTRMTIAGLTMIAFLALRDRKCLKIEKQDCLTFLKIAFFHIYLAFSCEFWALQSLSSSKTNLIYTATPFVAATLSYFILGERLSWRKVLGLILGLIGLLPVTLAHDSAQFSGWLDEFVPEALLFVAVISASYAWFDIKKMMQKGYSLIWINGFSMLVGGLGSLATAGLMYGKQAFVVEQPGDFLKFIALMILVSNFVFYNAYGWMMRRYSITFLTFAGFLSPVFGAIYGKLLLQESIRWNYGCSLALITLALYIFYKEELGAKNSSVGNVQPPEAP